MANKTELIAQLLEMGKILERELDTSGTVAELELRVREYQDEIDQLNDGNGNGTDGGPGAGPGTSSTSNGTEGNSSTTKSEFPELVKVRPLVTLHITDAWHETKKEKVIMAIANEVIRVSPELADELVDEGLATEVSSD